MSRPSAARYRRRPSWWRTSGAPWRESRSSTRSISSGDTEPMPGERTILRGGRVLRHSRAELAEADLLIEGGRIAAIEPWGRIDPGGARVIDAGDRILIPGLLNAHMHGHGNLSKGAGDRWTLELLLNASPWVNRFHATEDLYVTAALGAGEMLLKGCTAYYDLFVDFPAPPPEGPEALGRAHP